VPVLRRALAFAVWLFVVLALAEGAVRLAGWVLKRDQGLGTGRAGGTVIYAIGDSFTYGQGVQPSEAWPRVLAEMLRAEHGAAAPEVRTLAEPGRSSSVALLDVKKALEAGDARLLLVMTGWNANDGDFADWAARHDRPVPWTARADLWLAQSRLYRVVKHALTLQGRALVLADVKVVPQTTAMRLYDFRAYQEIARENLTRIARLCRAAGVPCAFLTYPHQDLPPNPYTTREYYHALFGRTPITDADYLVRDREPGEIAIDAVIRTVGRAEDVPVIDTQPAFARDTSGGLYLADWHHPTAKGHRLIAEAVLAVLERRAAPAR
jgi:lysophospholipase L1-like esterase